MSDFWSGLLRVASPIFNQGVGVLDAARQRSRALRMAADQVSMEAGVNAQAYQQDAARQEAAAFTDFAAAGGVTGSAVDVLNEFASASLYNARSIVYQGQTQARGLRTDAAVTQREGVNSAISSVFSAGSSLLGSYDQYRRNKAGVR